MTLDVPKVRSGSIMCYCAQTATHKSERSLLKSKLTGSHSGRVIFTVLKGEIKHEVIGQYMKRNCER